jgi:hypothetical protein
VPPLSGRNATLREPGSELRRLAGDADVAAEGEIEPVPGSAAVQRADGRGVEVVEHDRRGVAEVELAGIRVQAAEVAEAAARTARLRREIEAGAERAPVAGEHDAARLAVAIRLEEAGGEIRQHRPRDRVHALGSVQGDRRDVIAHFEEDLGHGGTVPSHVRCHGDGADRIRRTSATLPRNQHRGPARSCRVPIS